MYKQILARLCEPKIYDLTANEPPNLMRNESWETFYRWMSLPLCVHFIVYVDQWPQMPKHFVFRFNYLIIACAGYLFTNFQCSSQSQSVYETGHNYIGHQLNYDNQLKMLNSSNDDDDYEKKTHFTLKIQKKRYLKPFVFVSTLLRRTLFLAPTWMNPRVIHMQIWKKK